VRIGIASEWIGQKVGGPERYAVSLIESLVRADATNAYHLFVTPSARECLSPLVAERTALHTTASDSRWHFIPFGLPWTVSKHPVDILHATFSFAPWCLPNRIVLTVHDVCATVHPEFFKPVIGARVRWLLARDLSKATRVLVPTETSKRELLENYPIGADRISVIPYGVSQKFGGDTAPVEARPEWGEWTRRLSSTFILYVGRFHVRKNLERLIRAFSQVRERRSDLQLVLAGRDFWNRKQVEAEIGSLGLEGDVLCPGHVEDAALDYLYQRAALFAYPSIHEGFGFPPLEAMARGVPVLSSNLSAMAEVLGDAALLVDPFDTESIAHGLEQILDDSALRTRLIAKGRERVRQFTWERAARATLEVYHTVGEETRRTG